MRRKVFFSFHYDRDVWRVAQVRNSNIVRSSNDQSRFLDHADWESIRRNGDVAIKKWIDSQLEGSTVTCVLIGHETDSREWVHYEIQQSLGRKNAILGIRIHNIKNMHGNTDFMGFNPLVNYGIGYTGLNQVAPIHDWTSENGYLNFGRWIDEAVENFKRINHFRGL